MSTTARLSLPYIAPQQAQKQVTYNEAMALLDQLVQPAVKSRTTATPPVAPAEGDTYIVGPAPTDAWTGHAGKFACWLSGAWDFTAPADGWLAYVVDTAELAVYQSGAWTGFVTNGGASVAKFGINTTADLTNRLAVASDASLFTHAGTSHRMKLNKASAADTASLQLQDDFSSRAEFGLIGDDAFRVRVSPNGSSWYEALTIAQGSGLVSLPIGQLAFPATQNPSGDPNTLDDYEEGGWTPVIAFGGASTGVTYGAATLGRYTKVGRTVFISCVVTLTSKGSSTGSATLTGLPFTSINDSIAGSCNVGYAGAFSSITGALLGLIQPNTSRVSLYHSNNGSATALTNSNFQNTSSFYLSGAYDIA
jgi:hypothetical protein